MPEQVAISPRVLPSSFNSTSSKPNTEGGPSQTRLVLTVAVTRSPLSSYEPEYSKKLSPPIMVPFDSVTIPVPSPTGVLNQAEYFPFASIHEYAAHKFKVSSTTAAHRNVVIRAWALPAS